MDSKTQKNVLWGAILLLIGYSVSVTVLFASAVGIYIYLDYRNQSPIPPDVAYEAAYDTTVAISNWNGSPDAISGATSSLEATQGVGILLNRDGWVLTAKHVLTFFLEKEIEADQVIVTQDDFPAEHNKMFVIGTPPVNRQRSTTEYTQIVLHPTNELALVQVHFPEDTYEGLDFVKIQSIGRMSISDPVTCIRGIPIHQDGLNFIRKLIHMGRISGSGVLHYTLKDDGYHTNRSLWKRVTLDLNVYQGDSGAPVIDTKTGDLLGIVTEVEYRLPFYNQAHQGGHQRPPGSLVFYPGDATIETSIPIIELLERAGLDPDDYVESAILP